MDSRSALGGRRARYALLKAQFREIGLGKRERDAVAGAADSSETIIVDARGHKCPTPVLRAEAALRRALPGAVLQVLADDPLAAIDLPYFCREAGCAVERQGDRDGAMVFVIKKPPAAAAS